MAEIDTLLRHAIEGGASDLHVLAGDPPRMRQYGDLTAIAETSLASEQADKMIQEIMTPEAREQLAAKDGADFAYAMGEEARFRVNVFRHINGLGAVLRSIPGETLTLDKLNAPRAIRNLCKEKQGLVLVTGKTGSGKSTTLAAMVNEINTSRKGHILTIEDPIEFTHKRIGCLVSQREVGRHTSSFAAALKSALREDPDVILVGEMRDLETMSIAVTAAETGILVMGTLHTNSAAATVDRIINTFPADKQGHIRSMLSTSLRGVIAQQLLKRSDNKGRVAAMEIMVNTNAIGNLIRQGKIDQIETAMQGAAQAGMETMDNALKRLVQKRLITGEVAYLKANHKSSFKDYAPEGADI
ncbi:MAG: type IV pilus twitching motility protein PilT [Gammaproteobacteria bacterium]|nr:type IV pilus twitching motility protein PilT [Gammaproteobacteria bacterium]